MEVSLENLHVNLEAEEGIRRKEKIGDFMLFSLSTQAVLLLEKGQGVTKKGYLVVT